MTVVQNGYRDKIGAMKYYGLTSTNNAYPGSHTANFHIAGTINNFSVGEAITDNTVGLPNGGLHPTSWLLPQKSGGLSSHNDLQGSGTASVTMAGGKATASTLSGSGTLSAAGQLVISMAATLAGTGTISGAQLQAFLQLAAAVGGTGSLASVLTAIGHILAAPSGSGATSVTARATGELLAAITVTGADLTAGSIAAAVWTALSASFNDAGTMGNKLNSAASAGDPWSTALPGAYADGEAGFIIGNIADQIMDDAAGVESGLTLRQAMRLIAAAVAGKISGAATSTITIKNAVADDTDRIVANTDVDGNRTAITYDLN